jgi:hypothetical protein
VREARRLLRRVLQREYLYADQLPGGGRGLRNVADVL